MKKAVYQLKIGHDFRWLAQPLESSTLKILYQELATSGCSTIFPTWNLYLLDCFEEYEFCIDRQIPFGYKELTFHTRVEALAWACERQLSKKGLTAERRKYLLGIRFEAERAAIARTRISDCLQSNTSDLEEFEFLNLQFPPHTLPSRRSVGMQIGDQYHVVWNTIVNYAEYARRIECLRKKAPEAAAQILNGQYRLSLGSLDSLAKMSTAAIREMIARSAPRSIMRDNQHDRIQTVKTARNAARDRAPQILSVKDMPLYDPDAELTSLSYTIPSWIETLQRVRIKTDVSEGTQVAKDKLAEILINLSQEAGLLFDIIMEE